MLVKIKVLSTSSKTVNGHHVQELEDAYFSPGAVQFMRESGIDETMVYLKDGAVFFVPMSLEEFGDILRSAEVELFELELIEDDQS